jgi:hypothetical protein
MAPAPASHSELHEDCSFVAEDEGIGGDDHGDGIFGKE